MPLQAAAPAPAASNGADVLFTMEAQQVLALSPSHHTPNTFKLLSAGPVSPSRTLVLA